MTWLNDEQKELFGKVFENPSILPKNRKNSFKLRNLSFFSTDTKSTKQMVPYIIQLENDEELARGQYYNALRNSGLIEDDKSINSFGRLFLSFLHRNDDEALNAIQAQRDTRNLDDKYILSLELVILLAVNYKWRTKDGSKIVSSETLENLFYFKANIIDSISEYEQRNFDFKSIFKFEDNDLYLMLQGINYQGYEIKKLIHLRDEIEKFKELYNKAYEECPITEDEVEQDEKKYYEQIKYFKDKYQKDIRYRVKMTLYLSLVLEDIVFPRSLSHLVFSTTEDKENFIKEHSLGFVLGEYMRMMEDNNKVSASVLDKPHQRIFFGAPGTGKSYELSKEAKEYFGENFERVTFHPNYMYGNFVGAYKPFPKVLKNADGTIKRDEDGNIQESISYEYVAGVLMCQLLKALKNPTINYLLIVEEINRANVAAVFGDIFQLLDRDGSGESEYVITVSKELQEFLKKEFNECSLDENVKKKLGNDFSKIFLPKNFYVWATMNSADQGVMPMDTAFRRRWEFKYLGIDEAANKNRDEFVNYRFKVNPTETVNWDEFRRELNKKLSALNIPEDKLIGPYFVSKSILEDTDIDKLTETIKNKVLMYLYEDAAKAFRSSLFAEGKYSTYSTVCKFFGENALHLFKGNLDVETNAVGIEVVDTKGEETTATE